MTIDALRSRKQDLTIRRQQLEQDGRDKLAIALVKEELMDVNVQLRALTYGRRKRGKDTSSQYAQDRQQFDAWAGREDQQEAEQQREALRETAAASLGELSRAQRQTLELYTAGLKAKDIAAKLGVSPSTVSRNLSRAKKNAAESVRLSMEGQRLTGDGDRVDLNDAPALRAVVMTMTPKQMVYFYLYYSEGLTMREIEVLVGVDKSAISRTIKRALIHIDRLFGGRSVVLEHPEMLDELVYWAYCEIEDHPEQVPEQVRTLVRRHTHPTEYYRKYYKRDAVDKPSVAICRADRKTPGKLLLVLREKSKSGQGLFQWLEAVFSGLKQLLKGRK